jgi:hypothetical protein
MAVRPKGGLKFPILFMLISIWFIGILGVTYYFTKKANPILLDEKGEVKGRPVID